MSTVLDERTKLNPDYVEPGDHDRFAHYAKKDDVLESLMTGKVITAICGKKFVQTRNPEKFPVCPACKEIYANLPD